MNEIDNDVKTINLDQDNGKIHLGNPNNFILIGQEFITLCGLRKVVSYVEEDTTIQNTNEFCSECKYKWMSIKGL